MELKIIIHKTVNVQIINSTSDFTFEALLYLTSVPVFDSKFQPVPSKFLTRVRSTIP